MREKLPIESLILLLHKQLLPEGGVIKGRALADRQVFDPRQARPGRSFPSACTIRKDLLKGKIDLCCGDLDRLRGQLSGQFRKILNEATLFEKSNKFT